MTNALASLGAMLAPARPKGATPAHASQLMGAASSFEDALGQAGEISDRSPPGKSKSDSPDAQADEDGSQSALVPATLTPPPTIAGLALMQVFLSSQQGAEPVIPASADSGKVATSVPPAADAPQSLLGLQKSGEAKADIAPIAGTPQKTLGGDRAGLTADPASQALSPASETTPLARMRDRSPMVESGEPQQAAGAAAASLAVAALEAAGGDGASRPREARALSTTIRATAAPVAAPAPRSAASSSASSQNSLASAADRHDERLGEILEAPSASEGPADESTLSLRAEAAPSAEIKLAVDSFATQFPQLVAQVWAKETGGAISSNDGSPPQTAAASASPSVSGVGADQATPKMVDKTFSIQLVPEAYGAMTIEMKFSRKGLALQIEVTSARAASLLRSSESSLRSVIESVGASVHSFAIEVSPERATGDIRSPAAEASPQFDSAQNNFGASGGGDGGQGSANGESARQAGRPQVEKPGGARPNRDSGLYL